MQWTVKVSPEEENPESQWIQLGLKAEDDNEFCWVTQKHSSLEQWKEEVLKLSQDLQDALQEGEKAWKNKQQKTEDRSELADDPEEIWKKMQQFEDNEEMSLFFNQLNESLREKTAEFILTQASMFKGKGPYFAQNYDHEMNKIT